ncbi:hypothetical protein BC332_13776 [Capsicum chinense]|nr:hypothetical protein BC332_13776 [Capsicum chinense]
MSKSKSVSTPLASHFKISSEFYPKTEETIEIMSNIPYSSVVGGLMYAMVCTRPDLAYTLKGTINLGLVFDRNKVTSNDVVGFVDSDYGGDIDRHISLSGYNFTLCSGSISWKASLQSIAALSTTEAEYVTTTKGVKEATWLRGLILELGVSQDTTVVFSDSQSVIYLTKNDFFLDFICVLFLDVSEFLTGGVISRKEKKEFLWLEALNNLSSFIFKDTKKVVKVIQLSYDHLSDYLKPCFPHLASYPKDKYMVISELKDLRSAQGLVEPTDLKSAEEVMKVYVDELVSSSLVIVRGGSKKRCQIHDLVHDFCSIKAREEKFFDITNKKNPSIKHLFSLKIHVNREYLYNNVLPYNFHLRHLRLLKMMDLTDVNLTDFLMNEIGMLAYLRCLIIRTEEKALPPPFSNLRNLETLVVRNGGPDMVLSPSIWRLVKLQRTSIYNCSFFDSDIDEPTKLENLTTIDLLNFSCSGGSEDIFTSGFDLTVDALSRIGRSLPNLQRLGLVRVSIHGGEEWNMAEVTFENLKSLKFDNMSFSEWHITDQSFPVLSRNYLYTIALS